MELAFVLVMATAVAFVLFATAFWREASAAPTRRVRGVAVLATALCVQFAIGAAWSAGAEAADLGWVSESVGDFMTDWLGLAVEVVALGVGVAGLRLLLSRDTPLHQAERMTAVLSARVARIGRLDGVELTAREVDVLEEMARGRTDDRGLAEALSISPATAATHVRNIMRKAGVRNRSDLLLIDVPTHHE